VAGRAGPTGILIGLIAGKLFIPFGKGQVIASENMLFVTLMHGVLCLFLLEMGITACERLQDLKAAGVGFIVFGMLAPNLFALFGIVLAHLYSMALGHRSRSRSTPCSRCCAGRRRTSRCRPCGAWPSPRPARRCRWRRRWA
jgi:hypothetical protein